MPFILKDLLAKMKNKDKNDSGLKKRWRPIANFEQYIKMKKIADESIARASSDPEELREFNRKNHENIIHLQEITPVRKPRRIPPPKFTYTDDFDRVKVDLSVSKSGKVRVKLIQPMVVLHENYWSKGICPPLKEYIIHLKYAGYPDDVLERYMKVHMQREKNKQEMEKFIDSVFGAGSRSSAHKTFRISALHNKNNNNNKYS